MNKIQLNISEKSQDLLIEALLNDGDAIHKIVKTNEGYNFYVDLSENELKAKLLSPSTLQIAKKEYKADLYRFIDDYQKFFFSITPEKQLRYETKYQAAKAYNMKKQTSSDIKLLEAEAIERHLSLNEHVEAILKAHDILTSAIGAIEAFRVQEKKIIKDAKTLEEVEKLQQNLPLKIQNFFEGQINSSSHSSKTISTHHISPKTKRRFFPFGK